MGLAGMEQAVAKHQGPLCHRSIQCGIQLRLSQLELEYQTYLACDIGLVVGILSFAIHPSLDLSKVCPKLIS
jgi:hypothetical protein